MLRDAMSPGHSCEEALATCRSLLEAVPDLLLLVGRDGAVQYQNRPADAATTTIVGTRIVDQAPNELRDGLGRSLQEILEGAEPCARVTPALSKDGSTRWYSTRTAPVVRQGHIVGAAIHARDVSESIHAERAIQECEARYRTLVDHAAEAIVVLDVDAGHFVDANSKACALFGLSREALLQTDPVTLSPPEQSSGRSSGLLAREKIESALKGEASTFEWVHRTAAGMDVPCEVRLVRLPGAGRRLVRGSVVDITAQRRLEAGLQRWQRVESMGQFASGIAHEFNNLLLAMTPSVESLTEGLADRPGLRLEAGWIKSAIDRGSVLTNRLLAFSRTEESVRAIIDVDSVIRDSVGLISRLLPPQTRLLAEPGAEKAQVACGRYELDQVLMNLVLNAKDAMPKGGTVTLTSSRLKAHAPAAVRRARAASTPSPVVRLRVADSGTGMDEATKARIFDAFFTTKSEAQGTGLGLSITHDIVRRAGGWMEVTSQLGVGSVFDVFLPEIVPDPADSAR